VLAKFRELGSARQVFLWARQEELAMPIVERNAVVCRIVWKPPAYHTVLQVLQNPIYAGAYAFGRHGQRTTVKEGRARKTNGHSRPMSEWLVLLKDNHAGYISWAEFEENQRMIVENAHMQKRAARKSARGGRALLTGLTRCGRCGRMMRVFYGTRSGHAHRYQCRGDDGHVGSGLCIGIGGKRIDQAVAINVLEAVSDRAVEAAILATEQSARASTEIRQAIAREIEEARYEATLASRRYELVDPAKRLVVRELEARWNAALERVSQLEQRLQKIEADDDARPKIDRDALMNLAHDLPAAWNAPTTDARTRQRLTRIVIEEVVIDLDDATNEAVVTIHWVGGRHTEVRVARVKTGRHPADRKPNAVEVMRKLGGQWPDREVAVTMNRMRCRAPDGATWTTVRARELRERLGIAPYDPAAQTEETISVDETAQRLKICVGSVHLLIRQGVLPATQLMPSAPWKVPLAALETEAVKAGVRAIMARRPKNYPDLQALTVPRLPGL
jgi:hypothetical protein